MSQYPPAYPPPPSPYPIDFNYYEPGPELLGPARRASIGLFVLAGLLMLCGACMGIVAWYAPLDKILEQSGMQLPATTGDISPERLLRIAYSVMGVLGALLGVVFIVLGLFVRRGGRGAAITSIVICVLLLLFTVLYVVVALVMGLRNPAALPGALVGLVPLVVLIMVIVWLMQAIRAAPHIAAQQQQMAAQMWQYQQQQAAYGGYGQTPTAAPTGYGNAPPQNYGSTPPGGPVNPQPPPAAPTQPPSTSEPNLPSGDSHGPSAPG